MSDHEQEIEGETEAEAATGGHVCPECGETYRLAMHLGLHRKREHGIQGSGEHRAEGTRKRKAATGGSSASSATPKARRKTAIASTLRELADLADDARGRTTEIPAHLADVIRRDADKIATTLAAIAEKVNPVAWFIDTTMGPSGVLTLAVGLSGVGRWLLGFWRAQVKQEPEGEVYPVGDLAEPVPFDRFAPSP